jgi:hypothetical protein
MKAMTKKEFTERSDYHKYTGAGRNSGDVNALFFDWKQGMGYKWCVYARACNATKQELVKALYDVVTGKREDVEYYIQIVVAPTDEFRFKVPLSGSGLNTLINGKKLYEYLENLKKESK